MRVSAAPDALYALTPAGPQGPSGSADAWARTGNAGTDPSTHFLGTTDNRALALRVNNSEAVRLVSDGKVGIGTTSPSERLQVDKGNLLVRGNGNFVPSEPEARLMLGDPNNYIEAVWGQGLRLGAYANPNALVVMNGGAGGSVGIGTTAPSRSAARLSRSQWTVSMPG